MPGPVSQSYDGPPDAPARVLTCVFCGQAYPPGTPAAQHQALYRHVIECPKHPLARAMLALRCYAAGPQCGDGGAFARQVIQEIEEEGRESV